MRDLLNIIDSLLEGTGEGNLAPSEFKGKPTRFDTLIKKIRNQEKFTTVDNQEVVIDASEADRFLSLWDPKTQQFTDKSAQTAKLATNSVYAGKDVISLGKLKKTTEFGGAGLSVGAAPSSGGKASYAVKPQNIGIVDKDIPAADLYDIIVNNSILQSTDYGKIVIDLATYIVSGEQAIIPEEARKNDKLRAAIQDNAGEYLGVLALLYHRSRFPRRQQFEEWLGSSLDDLVLRFPSAETTPLADSYANITNVKTQHTINISSKGRDGGAAPSIKKGLKIPDHLRQNPKLKNAVGFVDICIEKGTLDQAFDGLDFLYKVNPKVIGEEWKPFLPFSRNQKVKESIINNLRGKGKLGSEWKKILAGVASKDATDGGKVIYAIKREVERAINQRNILPEFADLVLEVLEMNFVQQYTDYEVRHHGEFTFATQWPAKLDGKITLENKSSAKDPTTGGFSFKLSRTDDSVSDEPSSEPVDNLDSLDDLDSYKKPDLDIKAHKEKKSTKMAAGREKQKNA